MIELTVKTLDSKNHNFSVADDITVKQLKEQIADSVNISADSQRLIYCGRVLQDEKNLSEYDVNGKVIHLVQRAPPVSNGSGPDRGGNSARSGANVNVRRSPFRVFTPNAVNVPGNAMYLGAVAFPGEIMDASGMSMQQPRQCLSQSRLNVVRKMLQRASVILNRLENNPQESADTSPDNGTPNGSSSENNAEEEENTASGSTPVATVETVSAEVVIASEEEAGPSLEANPEAGSQATPQTQQTSEQQAASNEGEGEGDNANPRYPRTRALADLLDQAADVNTRVQPFMAQYQQLMRDDPPFSDQAAVALNQRLFSSVSEIMHNLAHAYHALSDIMCDFSHPPPRFLRCRPVLIHHSAVVQTGIPIQVATSFTAGSGNSNQQNPAGSRRNGNTASSSAPSTTSTSPAPTDDPPPSQLPVSQPDEEVTVTSSPATESSPAQSTAPLTNSQQTPPTTTASRGGRTGQVVGSGSGFEIFVDVAPGSITIDSVETAVVTNAPNNSADGNTWQNPPEFVQNLISALAGQFMGATVQQFRFPEQQSGTGTSTSSTGTNTTTATASSTTSSSTGQGAAAAGAGVQNSQARGNTATHPTTATQTRSTARPHVHLSPGSIHGLSRNNFDPFLPCNSHHIRSSRMGRHRSNSLHSANTNGTNSGTETSSASTASARAEVPGSSNISVNLQADPASNVEQQQPRPATSNPPRLPPEVLALIQSLGGANAQTQQIGPPRIAIEFQLPPDQISLPRTVRELIETLSSGQPGIHLVPNEGSTTAGQNPASAGQSPATLAQMLESVPGYSYTPGESILTDVFMILAQCLSFMDMIQLGMGGSECLVRARPQLRQLISQRLLNNQPLTISAITQIIDRFNAELRPYYSVFENARMREEVDLPASINLYNHSMIPSLLNTVMKEDQSTFHRTLIRKCTQYVRQLCALLQYCCLDGVTGLENVLRALVTQMNANVPVVLQEWTMTNSIINFRTFVSTLNVPVDEVKRFLVYRMGNPVNSPQPATTPPPNPPAAEPMDVEEHNELDVGSTPNLIREPPVADVPPTQHINEALGWQSALPSEWVPIITRDSQRQRRQNPQGPFSDAYLSGMPSKRRKLITSAKPQGNLSQVITDSMTSALGAAGMSSGPEVDVIAQRAGQDDSLRTAYREQVRTTLQHNLNSNPDYLPEKYPNTAKYFNKH